jgi:hypothetical protein
LSSVTSFTVASLSRSAAAFFARVPCPSDAGRPFAAISPGVGSWRERCFGDQLRSKYRSELAWLLNEDGHAIAPAFQQL